MPEWVPIIRAHTIVIASTCVGLTFPGMMEEPGSFAGSYKAQRIMYQYGGCAVCGADVHAAFIGCVSTK